MENKGELVKNVYINTPFEYLKRQKGLTNLQQDIMNRVSAHLQKYINEYWDNEELRHSKENPRTFLTDEQIRNIKPIRIFFSELKLQSNTYERLEEAREALRRIGINGLVETENGIVDREWSIFPYIDMPVTDTGTTVMKKEHIIDENGKVIKVGEAKQTLTTRYRGYMDLHLNKALIKDIFNIVPGYVTHPEKIAQMSKVPNMPLMYFFIRRHMNNFKPDKNGKMITSISVELDELREYLGFIVRDSFGTIVRVKHKKYSQLKSKVLLVALAEIKKKYEEGLIDAYFELSEFRPRGKKIGDPSYIIFKKIDNTENIEEAKEVKVAEKKKKKAPQQTELQFSDETQQEVRSSGISWLDIEKEKKKQKELNCWQSFLLHYKGRAKDLLTMTEFRGFKKRADGYDILVLSYSDDFENKWKALQLTKEEALETWRELMKHFKDVNMRGIIRYIPEKGEN